ncbi:hypothetical protein Vafri_9524 [Volvox africanus]|uniref:Protein kinase domain-containing protein n=1 Tax=Volvox africanus TaxID=51714 RepID=A0A8J4B4L1_9CHLO|nr:hypothetical protein Vafri_9524 [Volvox africanus]
MIPTYILSQLRHYEDCRFRRRLSESRIFPFLGPRLNDCTSQSSSQPHMLDSRQSSPDNKPRSQFQSPPEPPGPSLLLPSAASGGESPLRTVATIAPDVSVVASSSCAAVKPSPLPPRVDSAMIQILDPSVAPEDLDPYPQDLSPYADPEPWYDNDIVLSVAYNGLAAKNIAYNVQPKEITRNYKNSSLDGDNILISGNVARQRQPVVSGGTVVQLQTGATADSPAAAESVVSPHRPRVTLKKQLTDMDTATAAMASSLQRAPPSPSPSPLPQPAAPLRHLVPTQLLTTSAVAPEAMRRPHWCMEDYAVDRRLYRSSTASVYSATCIRSGLPVALKIYSLAHVPRNVVHMLRREVEIQTMLVHKNIVRLYGAFQDSTSQRLVLVLELGGNGSLVEVHRALCCRMSESQARVLVLRPLLEAMSYFHSLGIVHRDIKPDNILFSKDWRLLLADFGIAIDITAERAVTRAGTVEYMAPEVERCPLKMLPEENKENKDLAYTTAVDVWAVGCLAYLLLLGFPPYIKANNHNNHNHNYHCHANNNGTDGTQTAAAEPSAGSAPSAAPTAPAACGSRALTFPTSTSPLARDFISAALADRPEDRPTARQLLQHPWMQQQHVSSTDD